MDFHNNGHGQASFWLNHNYVPASLDPTCDVTFAEFFWCKRTHGRIPQVELMVVGKHLELFTQYHHNWRSNITLGVTRREECSEASDLANDIHANSGRVDAVVRRQDSAP